VESRKLNRLNEVVFYIVQDRRQMLVQRVYVLLHLELTLCRAIFMISQFSTTVIGHVGYVGRFHRPPSFWNIQVNMDSV